MGDSNKGSVPLASLTSLIMDSGLRPMSFLDSCSVPSCFPHLAPSSCSFPFLYQPVFLWALPPRTLHMWRFPFVWMCACKYMQWVCGQVCVCMYVCTCKSTCICARVRVYVGVWMNACLCTCVCMHTYACVCVCVYVCAWMRVHMGVYVYGQMGESTCVSMCMAEYVFMCRLMGECTCFWMCTLYVCTYICVFVLMLYKCTCVYAWL